MFGDRRLILSVFTRLVVSRRVFGSFHPDHLHVSVDLHHLLPQTFCFLLINGPCRVLCSWKGVWEGDLVKIP